MRGMKDSGAKWIGYIPENWSVDKLKFHLRRKEQRNPGDKTVLSLYRELGVIPKDSRDDNHNVTSEDTSKYKYVHPGDFVINKMKAWQGSVAVSDYEGIVSPAYFVYIFTDTAFYKRYFHYLMRSCYKDEFMRLSGGIRVGQWDLPSEALDNIIVLIPPLPEQRHIATFLDAKCAEINALTANIQSQIDTLEQYKRSVITEAVTKGLNPDVEMQDSRIHWVDKLPRHWDIIPSKYLFRNSDLRKQAGDVQLTASQNWGIIPQEEYMERTGAKIVFANQGLEYWKHVEPDDFVISLRSFQGGLEMSSVTGCITWHYVVLKAARSIVPRFYKWLFKSDVYIAALQRTCNFIRDGQDLRYSNFSQVPLYIPPMDEQRQIADYLDDKCSGIDTIIDEKRTQKNILEQYKKSLIFEYVTGKRK